MGAPEPELSVDDPSFPTSDPPPPSHEGAHDPTEPLSEHESAFLDQSISLLDQEYDHQRQLIDRYSRSRQQTTDPHPKPRAYDVESAGQQLGVNNFESNRSIRGNTRPPPRIYTGMEDGATVEKGELASKHNAYAYQYHHHRRPLIDRVHNKWRPSASTPDFSPNSPTAPSFAQIVSAPKFRRYLTIILLVILIPWSCWRFLVKPKWEDHQILDNALNKQLGKGAAYYGLNVRPAFRDMIQLQTWDTSLLSLEHGAKRLIFIGDIHGCHDERKFILILASPWF